MIAAALFAVVGGAVAALGNPRLAVLPLAVPLVVLAVLLPVSLWIWALVVASVLVVGPLIYFASADAARWIPPLLFFALVAPLILRAIVPPPPRGTPVARTPGFVWWFLLFFVVVAFSTVFNGASVGELINSPRYYLVTVPLVALLSMGALRAQQFQQLWKFLLVVAMLQLPIAAVQHFVYAKRVVRSTSWDAVVGTFPGSAEGGGASAAMGVFLLIMLAFAVSLWRRKHLSGRWVAAVGLSTIGTIALAEVKAVVLLIPVVLGLVFYGELRRKPVTVLVLLAFGIVLAVGVLAMYDRNYYQDRQGMWTATSKPQSSLEGVRNQLDPDTINRFTMPGRVASFGIWWDRTLGRGDLVHALVGHGAAATQANNLGIGKLAPQFWYPLTQTSTAILLWEVGVIGHLLLVVAMLAAARTAARLSRCSAVPDVHRALLHASAIGLLLLTITLPYKNMVFMTAPSQAVFALLLGYTAFWFRSMVHHAPSATPGTAARSGHGLARRP